MSEVTLETCFHCEAPIRGEPRTVRVAGLDRLVCSDACREAAENIHALRLDAFYDYRNRFAKDDAPMPAPAEAVARDKTDDERVLEFSVGLRQGKQGSRLSVRVPDIRCAACTWLIENSLAGRPEVRSVKANLMEKVVTIDFDGQDPMPLVHFIEGLGFTVFPDRANAVKDVLAAERKSMLARIGIAGIGMMQVMMYALATYLAGSGGIEPAYESLMRWASLAVTTPIVFYSAMPFHEGALRDLRHRTLGMDVPVSLAVCAAYTLSVYHTLAGGAHVYFDSVAMFTFLLLLGRFVELGSRQRFQQSRMIGENLLPMSVVDAGSGQRVPITDVSPGLEVIVGPGTTIPVDGIILEGKTTVVEAAFTGESRPIEKGPGALVLAGADNLDGEIRIRVSEDYEDFVITKIATLYRESSSYKPRFAILSDVIARYFVASILLASAATGVYWYLAGSEVWFSIALAVLVVSCPCALSLATPVAYTVAVAAMRREGVVIANGAFLEKLAGITRIVFDKTGTLTRGILRIERVVTLGAVDEARALAVAGAVEGRSRHPVARAFPDSSLETSDF
ncbi:MAG: heavy metal translocating P-type ATPase metal-binding domain-containing protein, partial [Pseudomonadales bacterium]|nr:heavy metal translocating P-type ATPase metal-binding domain-containing protein [Pseudomonadales bacterium]